MRVVAHLQAMEGDEVDLHAEAWATTRIPGPLRGASGKLPGAHAPHVFTTSIRISDISSIAKRTPSRPKPDSFTPPYGM